MRGSHLLPSQLPGKHTGHKAASRHSEPFWNAHYSSTFCHCWYSFYLPTEGLRVESTPARLSQESVGIEPMTSHVKGHCSTNWAILADIHNHQPHIYLTCITKFINCPITDRWLKWCSRYGKCQTIINTNLPLVHPVHRIHTRFPCMAFHQGHIVDVVTCNLKFLTL